MPSQVAGETPPMKSLLSTAYRNAMRGSRGGIAFAAFYVGWATILYIATKGSAFKSQGVSYWGVVTVYLLGGALAGIFVGLLSPVTSNVGFASLVGMVAAIPIGAGFLFLESGMAWGLNETIALAIFSVAGGGLSGAVLFQIFRAET